ncbi:hypothetical protein BKA62DRAFT_696914 [Auriculariales sp. MPI-PUGE-AT-0066]|nr:hypothetical protein BKA62DRAFT_696914 [Auriculariales sp. MPI-PUGE-AT-0066]
MSSSSLAYTGTSQSTFGHSRRPSHGNGALAPSPPAVPSAHSQRPGEYNPRAEFVNAASIWRDADNAHVVLDGLQADVNRLKQRLREEAATHTALKSQNHTIFKDIAEPKKSSGIFGGKRISLGRRKDSPIDVSPTQRDFHSSYSAEKIAQQDVEKTTQDLTRLRHERDSAKHLAESSDECFQKLWQVAKIAFPHHYINSVSVLADATLVLEQEEQAAREAVELHADFLRACQTAQKTHELHRAVMDLCDSARDQQRRQQQGSFGHLAQISIRNEYAAALNTSVGARVCLKECLRLLAKHAALVPSAVTTHVNKLESLGVAQIVDINDILYGTRHPNPARAANMEVLEEQQRQVFDHLTRVAVWLQDRIPEMAAAENEVRNRQREARRAIVQLWEDILSGRSVDLQSHRSPRPYRQPSLPQQSMQPSEQLYHSSPPERQPSSPPLPPIAAYNPYRMSISGAFGPELHITPLRRTSEASTMAIPIPLVPGNASLRSVSTRSGSMSSFGGSPLFTAADVYGSPATTVEDPNCSPKTISGSPMAHRTPQFVTMQPLASGSSGASTPRASDATLDRRASVRSIPMPGSSFHESPRTGCSPLQLPEPILENPHLIDQRVASPPLPEYRAMSPSAILAADMGSLSLDDPSPDYRSPSPRDVAAFGVPLAPSSFFSAATPQFGIPLSPLTRQPTLLDAGATLGRRVARPLPPRPS